MTVVVDADILGIFQRAGALAAIQALGPLPWLITDTVWWELTDGAAQNRAYPATVDEMRNFLVAVAGGETPIVPMTPEAETLAKLSVPPVKEDPGELSVIALALHRIDTRAVLHDRAGVFRGVEELSGRVISIHGLLASLRDDHGLAPQEAQRISSWYCARYGPIRPPTWW